jgi:TolA-binding protein
MKKIVILILLTMLPFLSGCDREYNAEKLYWAADRLGTQIMSDPKGTPSGQYEQAIEKFRKIIQKYPESKKARDAQLKLGQLYMAWEKYPEAMVEFNEVLKNHKDDIIACATAQAAIANCYEQQGNWSAALNTYQQVFKNYKNTPVGLDIPFYIARYYQRNNNKVEADKAFHEAIAKYQKIINENPKADSAYFSQDYIALCYENIQDWDQAIKVMEKLRKNYPANPRSSQTLFDIATIYETKLDKHKEAIAVYRNFLDQYPNDNLAGTVRKIVETLEKNQEIGK